MFTDARTDERTEIGGLTVGRTHDGQKAMTIAHWPSASGANYGSALTARKTSHLQRAITPKIAGIELWFLYTVHFSLM